MSNTFQLPRPKLVREAKQRNQNHNMARDGKDRKVRGQTSKARPVIPSHDCLSESNCDICRYFLNELDKRRMIRWY